MFSIGRLTGGRVKINSLSAMEYKILAIPDGGIGTSFIKLHIYLSIGTSNGDKTKRYNDVKISRHWLMKGYLVIRQRHFGAYIVATILCRRNWLLLRLLLFLLLLLLLLLLFPSDVTSNIMSGSGNPGMFPAECKTAYAAGEIKSCIVKQCPYTCSPPAPVDTNVKNDGTQLSLENLYPSGKQKSGKPDGNGVVCFTSIPSWAPFSYGYLSII